MDNVLGKFEEKAGPLAVWQWGLLGAAVVLIAHRLNGPKAGVQTVTLTPTGNPAVEPRKGPGLGEVGGFLSGLGSDYSNFSFTLPDGSTFTFAGGVPHITPPPGGGAPPTGGGTSPGTPGLLPGVRPAGPTLPGVSGPDLTFPPQPGWKLIYLNGKPLYWTGVSGIPSWWKGGPVYYTDTPSPNPAPNPRPGGPTIGGGTNPGVLPGVRLSSYLGGR